jgi:hypothetical protein
MEETAVEWLFDTLSKKGYLLGSNGYFKTFKEAKAMEKEQIVDAFLNGDDLSHLSFKEQDKEAEQYYNETYNK